MKTSLMSTTPACSTILPSVACHSSMPRTLHDPTRGRVMPKALAGVGADHEPVLDDAAVPFLTSRRTLQLAVGEGGLGDHPGEQAADRPGHGG